jgi:serine/threonine protein kinase
MGRVFLVRHKATGARRALKVLEGAPDPEMIARFKREAEALARLEGKGVVPIHETHAEHGRFGFVMDWMSGGSLEKRIQEHGRFEWREAAATVAKLARTLERCAALGLVHRDVKPANVLHDDQGEPRLADFGCVHDLAASRLTETGAALGTPAYMAPEQWDGGAVDARADVFSLGAVLYELVAGERPHHGASPFAVQLAARQGKRRKVRELADVPPDLEAVIERALAANPARRQAGPGELAEELEAVLARRDVAARPLALGPGVLALLAVAAICVVGTAALVATRRPSEAAPSSPVRAPAPAQRPPALPPLPNPLDRASELHDKLAKAIQGLSEGGLQGPLGRIDEALKIGPPSADDREKLRAAIHDRIEKTAEGRIWLDAAPGVLEHAFDEARTLVVFARAHDLAPLPPPGPYVEELAAARYRKREEVFHLHSTGDVDTIGGWQLDLVETGLAMAPSGSLAAKFAESLRHSRVETGSSQRALGLLDKLAPFAPGKNVFHLARGKILFDDKSDDESALRELAVARDSPDLDAADRFLAAFHMAYIEEDHGRHEAAAKLLRDGARFAPREARTAKPLYLRVRLLLGDGDVDAALEVVKAAEAADPDSGLELLDLKLTSILRETDGAKKKALVEAIVHDIPRAR